MAWEQYADVNWERCNEFLTQELARVRQVLNCFLSEQPDWGGMCYKFETLPRIRLAFWLKPEARPKRKTAGYLGEAELGDQYDRSVPEHSIVLKEFSAPRTAFIILPEEGEVIASFVSRLLGERNLKVLSPFLPYGTRPHTLRYEIKIKDYNSFKAR